MKNLLNSLSRLFKRRRNKQIPEQLSVSQEKAIPQPPKEPSVSQLQKTKEKNQVKELQGETALIKETRRKEIVPPEIIRSEVNLLNLPFFALSTKGLENITKIEYRSTIQQENKKLEILWKVSSNPEYGYPGPFDKKVYKAIEQVIGRLKPPIENPVRLGSFYDLAKIMRLKRENGHHGGKVYKEIKEALTRIKTTSIQSRGAFYNKQTEKWLEDIFSLYDRVIFKGEKLDNGEIADTNYLYLGSWYLESLNARYVKPIDYDYYRSLKNPISCRLYELLGVKFYGVGDHQSFIRYKYSTLCQLLPVTRQRYKSLAMQQFGSAHEELKRTAFLKDYQWSKSERGRKDWYVTYWPGERVEDEIERLKLGEGSKEWENENLALEMESPREAIPEKTISPEDELLWQKALHGIEEEVSRASFEIYFSGIRLIELGEEIARIGIPAGLTPRQFQRFHSLIQKHLALVLGRKVDLKFEVLTQVYHCSPHSKIGGWQ